MFENDIMYGCVVSLPSPSANKFYYMFEWDIYCLSYIFPIAQYYIYNSVFNTDALKLRLQLAINRSKIGKYTFYITKGTNSAKSGMSIITNTSQRFLFMDKIETNFRCSPYFRDATCKVNIQKCGR